MQSLYESSDSISSPHEGFLYITEADNFPVRPHWHYFMELLFIVEGTVIVNVNNETYRMSKGDFILFHSRDIHSIDAPAELFPKLYVLKFDINRITSNSTYAPRFRTIFHNAKGISSAPVYLPAKIICDTEIESFVGDYVNEFQRKDYGYDVVCNSLLSALLTTVLRIWQKNGFDVEKATGGKEPSETIYTITGYIDAHSSEHLTVEEIAKVCNMSYSYFAKSFREYYGQTCKEFIEFIRVCKAEDFLLFTDYDLTYISQETGFSDCSHLIKTFRKLRGITPKQYQLHQKKNLT